MKLDLLAFGAHPDDVELTCSGTLLLSSLQSYNVGIIDLTKGEKGTRGSAAIREQERNNASKLLKLKIRESLDIPDTGVELKREYILKVAEKIRKYRPNTVILPPDDKRHPDHTHANQLVYEACFLAGLKNLDIVGSPHRPFKVLHTHNYATFDQPKPTFIVDISGTIKAKLKIPKIYKSQFPNNSKTRVGRMHLKDIEDWLEARARFYGMLIGAKYGEGFTTREVMQVDDIVKLKVPSL